MKQDPDAVVVVALLPSDQGGRSGPTRPGVFACIMVVDGVNLEVRLRPDGPLLPGTTRRVGLDFLRPWAAHEHLHVGSEFRIREAREIGSGLIEQLHTVSAEPRQQRS